MPAIQRQLFNWKWTSKVIPFAFAAFFVQLACWGILPAILPYAASRIDDNCRSSNKGASVLQWVYIASYGALVIGSYVAGRFNSKNILLPLIAFFALFFIQIGIASGIGTETFLNNTGGAILLVFSSGFARFLDGYLAVTIIKIVFATFSHDREAVALIVGAFGRVSILVGSLAILPFVDYLADHCTTR